MSKAGYKVSHERRIDLSNDPDSPQPHFIIDLYAERGDQIVLIECGDCKQNKLDCLRRHFKVIHYPFISHPHARVVYWVPSGVFAEDLGKRLVIT